MTGVKVELDPSNIERIYTLPKSWDNSQGVLVIYKGRQSRF